MLIGSVSYSVSALTYIIFFGALLTEGRRGSAKNLLLTATFLSVLWALSMAYQALTGSDLITPQALEFAKDIAWIIYLLRMLSVVYDINISSTSIRIIVAGLVAFILFMMLPVIYRYIADASLPFGRNYDFLLAAHLFLAVIGLVLIEQLYRNTRSEQRWVIKYLCLGLGGTYVFDFYMYSDGLLYQRIDLALWQARGFVVALVVPLIAIAIVRDPLWSPEIFISRRIVFHTTTLVGSGAYLLIMGIAGYYVRDFGGNWGLVAQAIFLFATVLALALLLFSDALRAKLKVLINKHFFPYKYDYREEWLLFIRTMSSSRDVSDLYERSIRAIAQIIDSPGAMLWLQRGGNKYECVESINMPLESTVEYSDSSFVRFIKENEFVINLEEYERDPELYTRLGELEISDWLLNIDSAWLVLPLIVNDEMLGFIVLSKSLASTHHFNWEDSDLLKTAARQTASHLALNESAQALSEALRFEEFNRISTFMVHDLKNLITQLSLVVKNAVKHKNNPLFMDDAIKTVGNSVDKMNRLLTRLKSGSEQHNAVQVDLVDLLEIIIGTWETANEKPVPKLHCLTWGIAVMADRDRLSSIIGHIIQNAQDATADDGEINVRLLKQKNRAVIEIQDTGCGMSDDFIRTNLFRPFETTKGESGMGIGVFEAREFVLAIGGDIEVESVVGSGTVFRLHLPFSSSDDLTDLAKIEA